MPETLQRAGHTPVYGQYGLWGGIIEISAGNTRANFSDALKSLSPPSGPLGILIPPWQRRLVWDDEDVEKLIHTQSNLFGTAILASLGNTNEMYLIDGLQRFSTATAILNVLYDEVLKPTPNNRAAAQYFTSLSQEYQTKQPLFSYNHEMLLNHGRTGIRKSYGKLFGSVKNVIDKGISDDAEKFAKIITRALMQRQIAVDPYYGFTNMSELIKTFLEINSTGVILKPVDLLRSQIISHVSDLGWSEATIEDFENNFTSTFQEGPAWITTLGTHMNDVMYNLEDFTFPYPGGTVRPGHQPQYVFPNWDNLDKKTLDDFFDYLNRMNEVAKEKQEHDDTKYRWPYLAEITSYKIPYAAIVWYYYKTHYMHFLDEKSKTEIRLTREYLSDKLQMPLEDFLAATENQQLSEVASAHGINEPDAEKFEEEAKQYARDTIAEILKGNKEKNNLTRRLNLDPEDESAPNEEEKSEINGMISEIDENLENYADALDHDELFGNLPDFLGGDLCTMDECRLYYRAVIRRLIDGRVGRTGITLDRLMQNRLNDIQELADSMNPDESGGLDNSPAENWTKGRLSTLKKDYAKRIFNAHLAPDRTATSDGFTPLIYSTRTGYYNIDHLIPESSVRTNQPGEKIISPGYLPNFAPLETDRNRNNVANPCSIKFRNGVYDSIRDIHPYCKWLVDDHIPNHVGDPAEQVGGRNVLPMDNQAHLLEGDVNKFHIDRVQKIYDLLSTKI